MQKTTVNMYSFYTFLEKEKKRNKNLKLSQNEQQDG
jgi:hypothetical protein